MENMQSFISQLGGMAGGSGAAGLDVVNELNKALSAGYGSDVAQLSGGGALRIQSLETTMMATIQENRHFVLMNRLAKSNATATVDEWTEQNDIGGFPGGSTNSEAGVIASAQGQYNRRVGMVKYLMTRREVTLVQSIQNTIVDSETVEYQNGAKQLLSDAEYLSFEGDSTVVPTEFDGIDALVNTNAGSDHVIDLGANPLDNIVPINFGAQLVSGNGNWGTSTDLFLSPMTQSDFDNYLDPAFRVPLNNVPSGGTEIGAPVVGIRSSFSDRGSIANNIDRFIREDSLLMPFESIYGARFAALAAANNYKPAAVAVAAANQANSKFAAAHAGQYYYAVTGITAAGESQALVSAQVAVAAGQGVTLTITPSAGNTETGYVLYRGRLGGTAGLTDLRRFKRIPRAAGGGNTTYVDLNGDVPGTTKAFMLNLSPGDKALTWRQFLPMMKFQLYPTQSATNPWAQLLFGYMRMGKAKHHVVFKNILPRSQVWRPFN